MMFCEINLNLKFNNRNQLNARHHGIQKRKIIVFILSFTSIPLTNIIIIGNISTFKETLLEMNFNCFYFCQNANLLHITFFPQVQKNTQYLSKQKEID